MSKAAEILLYSFILLEEENFSALAAAQGSDL